MRLLVCGGRGYYKREFMYDYLDGYEAEFGPISILINGKATGADLIAEDWATDLRIKVELYPANWNRYGLSAGPIRNQLMLEVGKPDLVIAFPGGTGTADMVTRARKAGVKVIEVEEGGN